MDRIQPDGVGGNNETTTVSLAVLPISGHELRKQYSSS